MSTSPQPTDAPLVPTASDGGLHKGVVDNEAAVTRPDSLPLATAEFELHLEGSKEQAETKSQATHYHEDETHFHAPSAYLNQERSSSNTALHEPTSDTPVNLDDINDNDKDDMLSYQESDPNDLLPPPDFRPFFTIIEDATTGAHHHPDVHYIFSDDDPEHLTNTTLDVIENAASTNNNSANPEHRVIIVDMAQDGKSVAATSSLSPNWQRVKATARQTPSLGGGDSGETESGLMMIISGQENGRAKDKGKKKEKGHMNSEVMLRQGNERLEALREVLGPETEDESGQRGSRQTKSTGD